MLPYAIQTVKLTKRFPQPKTYYEAILHPFALKETPAIENCSIHVKEGEVFGLLGPNGAGKTTLLKILSTLILPTEGAAFIRGFDVTKYEEEIKRSIGYVISEERSFYWRMTGKQNLKFFATLNNLPKWEAEKRINEVVNLVGLQSDIDKVFQNFSSGMKQKLAIARGLLTNPDILLLDEPTKNLDPMATHNLRRFIKDVIAGEEAKTVVIATNNMQEAEELCDRIAVMHRGNLKFLGSWVQLRRLLKDRDRYIFEVRGSFERVRLKLRSEALNARLVSLLPAPSSNGGDLLRLEIDTKKENISEIIESLISLGVRIECCYQQEISLTEAFAKAIE